MVFLVVQVLFSLFSFSLMVLCWDGSHDEISEALCFQLDPLLLTQAVVVGIIESFIGAGGVGDLGAAAV
eukprot:m.14638 g.14638  ORF g.14638 m.14638 type:complete len:69 (+) comp6474_c0_seq2:930-1136(+)